ncbi:MAG: HEXXH motif domain-containing protein, partial [Chloroflexota bacterium]
MRRLGSEQSSQTPRWVDIGYFHTLAAAAAFRSGIECNIRVPVRDGGVMLPTLGRARVAHQEDQPFANARIAQGSLQVSTDKTTVDMPSQFTTDAQNWEGARWVTLEADGFEWTVLLDDLDPFRSSQGPLPPKRLDTATAQRWEATFARAWALLVGGHPEQARQIMGSSGLLTVVPWEAKKRFAPFSSSGSENLGGAEMSEPYDETQAAVTLVHELGHTTLNKLMNLIPLQNPGDDSRLYVAWRDDPRPITGVLHGVVAFSVVANFYLQQLQVATGRARDLVALEAALWRQQVWNGAQILQARPDELTTYGQFFLEKLMARVEPWLSVELPPQAVSRARIIGANHKAHWYGHHLSPAQDLIDEAAAAWAAQDEVPASIF